MIFLRFHSISIAFVALRLHRFWCETGAGLRLTAELFSRSCRRRFRYRTRCGSHLLKLRRSASLVPHFGSRRPPKKPLFNNGNIFQPSSRHLHCHDLIVRGRNATRCICDVAAGKCLLAASGCCRNLARLNDTMFRFRSCTQYHQEPVCSRVACPFLIPYRRRLMCHRNALGNSGASAVLSANVACWSSIEVACEATNVRSQM